MSQSNQPGSDGHLRQVQGSGMTSLCFSAYPDEHLLPRNAMLSFQ